MTTEIRLALPAEYDAVGELTAEAYAQRRLHPGSDYGLTLRTPPTGRQGGAVGRRRRLPDLLGTVTFCPVGSVYREIGRDDEGEFRMLGVSRAPAASASGPR